jgi:hypothetical protein
VSSISIREIWTISVMTAVCAFLALATSAHAQDPLPPVSMNPQSADVGQTITFTDNTGRECPPAGPGQSYGPVRSWYVDGETTPQQSSEANTFDHAFDTDGSHTVRVDEFYPTCAGGVDPTETHSITFDVQRRLTGTIDVSPDPPAPNQQATLSVTPDGGYSGYTYAWDTDNDGQADDGTGFRVNATFTTTGPHPVRVHITDRVGHETDATRTIDVQNPPADAPPPPPPPPCIKEVHFDLSQFKTGGCFTQVDSNPDRYTTRDAVTLNGISFPSYGQTFTITEPYGGLAGHFTAPNSAIQLESFTAFSGDIDWTLPTGGAGDEKEVKSLDVAVGAQILGLNVRGKIALRLGLDAGTDGKYHATFPLNIELPGGFRAGPDTDYGRVTGAASLRVDDAGPHLDGLRLAATNVWIGKLKVESTCFSYIPSGGKSLAPCDQPSFDGTGTQYISCKSDTDTDRWDGNAVVKLPSGGQTRLGAFGGLANGQLANLGATLGFSGSGVPIAPSVSLTKLEFGLCLIPPPLQIKGTIGVGILRIPGGGNTVGIDGSVLYTDSTTLTPWTLQIGGNVSVFDRNIGDGSVTIRAYNGFDFAVNSKVDLYGIASLDGQIHGWVDADRNTFNIDGSVQACVGGGICAKGSGVVSSAGIAGCVTITSTYTSPDLVIGLDPLTVGFDKRTLYLTAGFGYRWHADWPDVFANSCDFAPYTQTRSFARAAGVGATTTERVARGTIATTLRVHGTHGPPKVVLHGPHGATITSPANSGSAQVKGRYMLVENPRNSTTNVLLIHPAAGRWTVSAAPGAKSLPTTIDRSKVEMPPTFAAKVRPAGAARKLTVAYAVPKGASVRLVEHAKGLTRTIAGSVHGRRCPHTPRVRPGSDQQILCATVRFRPTRGPGGVRQVEAVVSRKGIPLLQKDITSFRAPAEKLPSRPGALRARRANGYLVVAFPRSTGASRYAVSASLSDGRELGFDLAAKCRAVRIAGVPADVAAVVRIGGVRYDLQTGAPRSIKVPANVTTVGPKGKLPRRLWKPRLACS